MANITLGDNDGTKLPCVAKSEQDTLPHIPAAMATLEARGAGDLAPMIFGGLVP